MEIPWEWESLTLISWEWEGIKTPHFPICPLDTACSDNVCLHLKFWLIFFLTVLLSLLVILLSDDMLLAVQEWEREGIGINHWEWKGNRNRMRLNLESGMNRWEWEGMDL